MYLVSSNWFTIILTGGNINDNTSNNITGIRIADNIFLSKPIKGAKESLNIGGIITCSVGVASLLDNVEKTANISAMEGLLLKAADEAMYQAKGEGKNRVVLSQKSDKK